MNIPKMAWDSPEVVEYIQNDRPVILLGCPLAAPAANRWSPDYLSSIISPDFPCTVFASESNRFQYWDEKKNNGYDFPPPTQKLDILIQDFMQRIRAKETSEAGGGGGGEEAGRGTGTTEAASAAPSKSKTWYYLQQSVVVEMGPAMMEEYLCFSLEAALKFKLVGNWDAFSTNLLLVGPQGAITPCHFDEQQNLFAQLSGRKRARLFPPEAWHRLYTYPLNHACDRQSRVVLPETPGSCILDNEEDRYKFPGFENCDENSMEYVADLEPGEMLYIPQYWFHQLEALTDNTSLSWWFKHQNKNKGAVIDLNTVSKVAVRRNLERIIGQSAGGPKDAHNFFLAIASGRLPIPLSTPALPPQLQAPTAPTSIRTVGATSDSVSVVSADLASSCTITPAEAPPVTTPVAASLPVDVEAGKDIEIKPEWPSLLVQAVQIGSLVLPPGEAPAFIQTIAAGRFHGLKIT